VPAKTPQEVLTSKTLGGLEVQPVVETQPFINLLVYGDPGVGKTVLAGSASVVAEMSPVVFIDIEGGTFSLRNLYPQVDVLRVPDWRGMQSVYSELYDMKHGYKTVVLDSLSEIQKFSMYNIMRGVVRENPDRDPDIPGMREWGKNIEQIRRLVRGFRDLPMHSIFTALARYDKDERTGIVKTSPALSGKLTGEVGGFVDIVLFMYRKIVNEAITRLALSSMTDKQIAKDRSDRLPTVLENPTMQDIFDYAFGKRKKEG
jgi:hypothetical protein